MITPSGIVALVLSLILGSLIQPLDSNPQFVTQRNASEVPATLAQRALLVTAHPDDEAMFFAPTILALNKPNSGVSLFHVCLSTGNAEGLGSKRKAELGVSLDVLGISRNKRWIVDRPDLQDDINTTWDADVIAKVLKPYVTDLKIDTILTFDGKGVSKHPNHISIIAGAKILVENLAQDKAIPEPRLFALQTTPVYEKYVSFLGATLGKVTLYTYRAFRAYEVFVLDVATNFIPHLLTTKYPRHPDANASPMFISGFSQYMTAFSSMKAHESQMEWFRWLYIGFSEYMWVNTWVLQGEEEAQ